MNEKLNYQPPFTITPTILNLSTEICELITKIKLTYKKTLVPHLRKKNQIRTIRASLAIENNSLNIEQITAIINGKKVLGNLKEIKEVKNAYEVYEKIIEFNALSIDDFLKAHKLMMNDLIKDAGKFRSDNVGVFGENELIHLAPPAKFVKNQISNLFKWYKNSELHALIKPSIFHYEIEFLHPFSDGNGRLGRLWQSKLLGEYNELFYNLSVEELIAHNQAQYYKALNQSDKNGESTMFVEFMLKIIKLALKDFENDTLNGVINDTLNENEKAILKALKKNPRLTQNELALKLNLSLRTINRALKTLSEKRYIERIGAKKNGYYNIF